MIPMRILAPTLTVLRSVALVAFVVFLAACSRNPTTGVGNLGPNGGPPGSQQEFLVTVGDRVFFDTDSSSLSPTASATLDRQAAWLNRYTQYQHVLIEGHSDERGTREYNLALGARRANVVMNYLISKGVAANRLTMKSFGKERPVAICDNESCWSQNRRAVTVVQ
jgi:peptidoglycan-associated lipoprotein